MRRAVPFVIIAGCLGVGVLPALATPRTVTAGTSSWNPSEFAVTPADPVTWNNDSGVEHNLHVEGAQVVKDGAEWTYSNTYAARSDPYEFSCSLHPAMTGQFHVNATGTVPTASPTQSPTTSPASTASPGGTASPSPSSTTTGGGGGTTGTGTSPAGGGSGPAVSAFGVKVVKGRFCTRRTARCRTPGVFLTLDLRARQAVRARGTLRRGARRVRTVSVLARPGRHRVRLPGKALAPGRYSLSLTAGGFTRRVTFRVARS